MFLFRSYNSVLHHYPLVTKSLTGGAIFTLADFLSQQYQMNQLKKQGVKEVKYDFKRTAIATTMGTVFMTPLFHYWFTYVLPGIVKRLPIPQNSPQFVHVLSAMAVDQTIWAFGITVYYFIVINLLEHQSIERGANMVKENIVQTMITNWKIWPLAQIINFWWIPLEYRVFWVNLIGLFWQLYLVQIQHKEHHL